jgi:hypothetical protein
MPMGGLGARGSGVVGMTDLEQSKLQVAWYHHAIGQMRQLDERILNSLFL